MKRDVLVAIGNSDDKLSQSEWSTFCKQVLFNVTNFSNPPAQLPNTFGAGPSLQPGRPFTAALAGSAFGVVNRTVERTVGLGTNRQIQFALRLNF